LVFIASPLSIKQKEQKLVVSESGKCVQVGRHVYPQDYSFNKLAL